MKSKVILCLMIVYCSMSIYSEIDLTKFDTSHMESFVMIPLDDISIPIKIKKPLEDRTVTMFLPGINSDIIYNGVKYNTGKEDLDNILKLMIENSPNCKQVLVAHSQGGLRAIAYANVMSQLGYGERIKGIIIIGSPTRGYPALVDGIDTMKQKLNEKIDIINNGLDAVIAASDKLGNPYESAEKVENMKKIFNDSIGENSLLKDFTSMPPEVYEDLSASGDFVKNFCGVNFNRYIYDSNTDASRIPCNPVIPANIPLGFIIGKNNDPLSLVELDSDQRTLYDYSDDILSLTSSTHDYLMNLSKPKYFLDFEIHPGDPVGLEVHRKYKEDALLLKELLDNFNEEYGKIVGDIQNDLLIPSYAQSREINEIGGRPISTSGSHVVEIHDANHIGELNNITIWGTGEGFGEVIGSVTVNGGIIPQWYEDLKITGELSEKEVNEAKTNLLVF